MIPKLNAMTLQRASAAVALFSWPRVELAGPGHSPVTHRDSQGDGHSAWQTPPIIVSENQDQVALTGSFFIKSVNVNV